MELEQRFGMVRVWLRDRYLEEFGELEPDLTLTAEEMNALVVRWLRGPMGPQGPAGPPGVSA